MLYIAVSSYALCANLKFRHYDNHAGLSDNAVNSICQDDKGFIWFATNCGLTRFDGIHMQEVHTTEQIWDARYNIIHKIKKDPSSSNLWLGTDGGVLIFNPESGEFKRFEASTASGEKINDAVSDIHFDKQGNVYLIEYPLCYIYDRKTGRLKKPNMRLANAPKAIPGCIYIDNNDNIYIGYANIGIARYIKSRDKVQLIGSHEYTPLVIRNYDENTIIIGDLSHGVHLMDKKTGISHRIPSIPGLHTYSLYVNDIIKADDGSFWICTLSGLYILRNGIISEHYDRDILKPLALTDRSIISIFQDRDKNVWLGTFMGGVNCCLTNSSKFEIILPELSKAPTIGHHAKALETDANGRLWIGMEDGGLYMRTSSNNHLTPIRGFDQSTKIYAIERCGKEMWIGTFSKGVYVYNINDGKIKHYYKTSDPYSLKNNEIFSLLADAKGRIWIGTTTDLFVYQRKSDSFKRIKEIEGCGIKAITCDKRGTIWLATSNYGACRLNPETGEIKWYRNNPKNSNTICGGSICDVHCDTRGSIWFCTENEGLCRLNTNDGTFKRITAKDGLPSNKTRKMLEDSKGYMWVSTDGGLAKIKMKTATIEQTISGENRLPNSLFIAGAGTIDDKGNFCFGTINGAITFNPASINPRQKTNKVVITSLTVLSRNTDIYKQTNAVPANNISYSSGIELKHNESSFSISFSAMDYEQGKYGVYAYMMEGLDNGWIVRKGISEVSYNSIAPGKYTFMVKYSTDGIHWDQKPTTLAVTILPPLWLTPWAYAIYAILVCIALAYIWKRYNKERKRKMYIRKMNWEREKREELFKAKIDFFTYAAHELRTPVTLIKAPVEDILERKELPDDIRKELNTANQNIDRLHALVNELLEFRKIESEAYAGNPQKTNFRQLLNMITDSFRLLAQKQGISLKMTGTSGEIPMLADEEDIITILNNIIGNAVKYASAHVTIDVRFKKNENEMLMRVSNDGASIPENMRTYIFEPFVRGDENSETEGTGIGLALTSALTKKMNGSIKVSSENDETVFELRLPTINNNDSTTETKTAEAEPAKPEERSADHDYNTSRHTLLIVDDHKELSRFIADKLKKDYRTYTASDGAEALDILQEHTIDLVVSDIMMPNIDGYELCRRIKSNVATCHIPVILLTAKTLKENKMEGLENGADAYIDKPFSMDYLKSWIKNLIDNRMRIFSMLKKEPVDEVMENSFTLTDKKFTLQLQSFIRSQISEELSTEQLAEAMNMSRSNFYRKIKGLTGMTPGEFLITVRLDYAAELISKGGYRINEVCTMSGFKSLSHFSRTFQKKFGVSPKNYNTKDDKENTQKETDE